MGDANRGSRKGERKQYPAVCADCGNSCEVPFKPSGDKPVRCRECFSSSRDGSTNARKPMSAGRSEHYDLEFEKLNEKLDKILQRLTPVHTRDGIKKPQSSNEDDS